MKNYLKKTQTLTPLFKVQWLLPIEMSFFLNKKIKKQLVRFNLFDLSTLAVQIGSSVFYFFKPNRTKPSIYSSNNWGLISIIISVKERCLPN